ncbi:hypothetical protein [uncultured Legionella sp.]|uniref:hypothetical protein n=1 Tax=uncultured Legionella sp. TaxID=210934 RepID=UPI002636D304|nr:hypothetical protein [uncultured Legionella sp.]
MADRLKALSVIAVLSSVCSFSVYSDEMSFPCKDNESNFDFELKQPLTNNQFVKGWGLKPNTLQINPEFSVCMNSKVINWKWERLLASADYWVKQKLNYCHHYLPDYSTPLIDRDAELHQGGYCSTAKNIMPGSFYYQQQARWNYKGTGSETIDNWLHNTMWYGMDCSNYTAFIYNFAFGLRFSSNTKFQAGQRTDKSQNNLSPNQQSDINVLDNPGAAGKLVCRDNTVEIEHSCKNHGGYLSVIDAFGVKHPGSIQSSDLAGLHPGDLLFIATSRSGAANPLAVIHVVMWTGKQVGLGANDIHPDQIAPNKFCPQKDWMPHSGDWIITDSHYQGPDYRVITPCYYLNNLWGVRRVVF